jgi:hypothetical protein
VLRQRPPRADDVFLVSADRVERERGVDGEAVVVEVELPVVDQALGR